MILKFSDSVELGTDGPMRIEERADGLYVVGEGLVIGVDTLEEGQIIILKSTELDGDGCNLPSRQPQEPA